MMHVERSQALEFMFGLNKEARTYLNSHYISIRNGFINEGLIFHYLDLMKFKGYDLLETLYFEALKRNVSNRTLSLDIIIDHDNI
jgi:hypothetical protein